MKVLVYRLDFPQLKQCAILTINSIVHELPHEFLNDFKTKDLGNLRNLEKISKLRDEIAYCPVSSPEIKLNYQ